MTFVLDPRREKFAQGVADGLSQAEAYRRANPKKAAKWKDTTVWVNASQLMADPKVSQRVAELRAQLAEKALWKREDSVSVLSEIAHGGEKDADRVRAVAELNAMHGYDAPKKVAMTDKDGNDIPTMVHVVYASIGKR